MATLNTLRAGGAASESNPFQELLQRSVQTFDPDAYHVMQQRDEQLIEDELMHGVASKTFVYSFPLQGNTVTGVSVVGARQLASEYGGIKARIVATVEKRGALFVFRSFEPLNIETRVLHELEGEGDYYECIMQVDDIKTGNAIQVRKKESKLEKKRDGSIFERPHYDVICESKAYRNGVLSVLPQSVIQGFKAKHLAAGNATNEKTMDQLRAGALAFAAKHALVLDRAVLNALTYAEVFGVGSAAGQGVDAFVKAGQAIGLISSGEVEPPAAPKPPVPAPTPKATPAAPKAADPAANPQQSKPPADWEPTPEELAEIEAREKAEATGQAAAPAANPPASRRRANPPASME